jgi:ferredoxin, 2Fe-2S
VVKVSYVDDKGTTRTVDAGKGDSVMDAATRAGIGGIVAICGGQMVCGTCHVFVDPAWADKAGGPGEDEEIMLEALAGRTEVRDTSRLSCQIKLTPALDGLVVHLPKDQPGV